ncbi:MAG: hypothetical protein AABY22_35410, partial [Nanoarchaeota archaeon]
MKNNQLLPIPQKEGLFVGFVPNSASHFSLNNNHLISYWYNSYYSKDIGEIKIPKGKYEILGTYSPKEGFSFDSALIVESEYIEPIYTRYKNYQDDKKECKNKYESALSLLSVNGIYFENPLGEEPIQIPKRDYKLFPGGKINAQKQNEINYQKWQEAQSKVIEKLSFII